VREEMSKNREVYIATALRTAVTKAPNGLFKNTRPDDLLAHVLRGIVEKNPTLDVNAIDDVIIGCAMPEAEQGMNVARIGVLLAGLPDTIPGVTVNRFCSSGVQTISMAADRIATGNAEVIIAGGVESMSMVKFKPDRMRGNPRYFEKVDFIRIKCEKTYKIKYMINYQCFERLAMSGDSDESETIRMYFIKLREFNNGILIRFNQTT
jgi:acetyl-CoA acetyltransferase